MHLSARKLDKMIEEATVDCYDELEQASGFYTMIEDHLAVPFATEVPTQRQTATHRIN